MMDEIKVFINNKESLSIIKSNLMDRIESYDFLGSYNYAYML